MKIFQMEKFQVKIFQGKIFQVEMVQVKIFRFHISVHGGKKIIFYEEAANPTVSAAKSIENFI